MCDVCSTFVCVLPLGVCQPAPFPFPLSLCRPPPWAFPFPPPFPLLLPPLCAPLSVLVVVLGGRSSFRPPPRLGLFRRGFECGGSPRRNICSGGLVGFVVPGLVASAVSSPWLNGQNAHLHFTPCQHARFCVCASGVFLGCRNGQNGYRHFPPKRHGLCSFPLSLLALGRHVFGSWTSWRWGCVARLPVENPMELFCRLAALLSGVHGLLTCACAACACFGPSRIARAIPPAAVRLSVKTAISRSILCSVRRIRCADGACTGCHVLSIGFPPLWW